MQPSINVAYRVYKFGEITKAIAFNTRSRQFMFLDGLSAILLQKLIENTIQEVLAWGTIHELEENDINQFVETLNSFGFFSAQASSSSKIQTNIAENEPDSESSPELKLFQNFLRVHNRYYCFHIDLTNRCNEKCIHCYHPFSSYDHSAELSLEEIKSLIDIIYDLGVFVVTLSGGECLLRKDFFDILSYISDKGMMTTIFTNGMLLTPSIVEKFTQYRVNLVSISLYSDTANIHDRITQVPGSFDKTIAGIEILKKHAIPFELKCVVLDENIERIEQIRNFSKKINYGSDCRLDFSLCGKIDGNCSNFSHRAPSSKIQDVFYSDPIAISVPTNL